MTLYHAHKTHNVYQKCHFPGKVRIKYLLVHCAETDFLLQKVEARIIISFSPMIHLFMLYSFICVWILWPTFRTTLFRLHRRCKQEESYLLICMIYTIVECTVNNSWWWTEELSETCRVSFQNKFEKLVRLDGFIIRKFVTMHGHMNVKKKVFLNIGIQV
jgi:hypothetical protein